VELRTVTGHQSIEPEAVGFPAARQIVSLRRRVLRQGKNEKLSDEKVHLISSLDPETTSASELKDINREYWAIESDLHQRLDVVLDEDRSRVRTPKSAFILGMFRRLALSVAIPWIERKKTQKGHKRTSTRDFVDHLRANNARRGFDLIAAKSPTSWKN
jgi:predicted transposase YbfD/YdcC